MIGSRVAVAAGVAAGAPVSQPLWVGAIMGDAAFSACCLACCCTSACDQSFESFGDNLYWGSDLTGAGSGCESTAASWACIEHQRSPIVPAVAVAGCVVGEEA